MHDITGRTDAVLRALIDNTEFPGALSRVFSMEGAYEVQFGVLDRRVALGEAQAGWKVGLTSKAMQLQQNVHEPCLGHLLHSGHLTSPARLRFDDLMAPGFENELCLRIGRALPDNPDQATVAAAIDAVAPAIEVIEKRGVFAADLPLAIAGNAQQRAFVTGPFTPYTPTMDLGAVEVEVFVNGESRDRAYGREVLGNPLNSVIWLAEMLARYGRALRPGDLIMSGSFTRQYAVDRGDRVEAVFSGLGAAAVDFAA